jgi:hypothetical protein
MCIKRWRYKTTYVLKNAKTFVEKEEGTTTNVG